MTGILLFIPLLFESLPYLKERRMWWHVMAACILAGSGLAGFMLYLWIAFGDPPWPTFTLASKPPDGGEGLHYHLDQWARRLESS